MLLEEEERNITDSLFSFLLFLFFSGKWREMAVIYKGEGGNGISTVVFFRASKGGSHLIAVEKTTRREGWGWAESNGRTYPKLEGGRYMNMVVYTRKRRADKYKKV